VAAAAGAAIGDRSPTALADPRQGASDVAVDRGGTVLFDVEVQREHAGATAHIQRHRGGGVGQSPRQRARTLGVDAVLG
jgi:hypothetical protein